MLILQIISALLLFLNKFYVLKERSRDKARGWLYGIAGTVFISIYFYLQMILQHRENLWIMIVYDCALTIIMAYAYVIARSDSNKKLKDRLAKWDILLKRSIAIIAISICAFLFIQALDAKLVLPQLITACGGLGGSYFLAFKTRGYNIAGWLFYLMAHIACSYLMFKTGSPVIGVLQIASGFIALKGLWKEKK